MFHLFYVYDKFYIQNMYHMVSHFNITEEIFLLQLRSLIHRKFNLIKTIKQSGNHLALAASLFHR